MRWLCSLLVVLSLSLAPLSALASVLHDFSVNTSGFTALSGTVSRSSSAGLGGPSGYLSASATAEVVSGALSKASGAAETFSVYAFSPGGSQLVYVGFKVDGSVRCGMSFTVSTTWTEYVHPGCADAAFLAATSYQVRSWAVNAYYLDSVTVSIADVVETPTPAPPTATDVPTFTPVPPTATDVPTFTPIPPTATFVPTNTPENTATPTYTPENTATPINTATNTPLPTNTPTYTPIPPTATLIPTNTPTRALVATPVYTGTSTPPALVATPAYSLTVLGIVATPVYSGTSTPAPVVPTPVYGVGAVVSPTLQMGITAASVVGVFGDFLGAAGGLMALIIGIIAGFVVLRWVRRLVR